jgi:hypothetical protein
MKIHDDVDDDDDVNNVLNTTGLRQVHVLHCSCLSPVLLSPTYETSIDAHMASCHILPVIQ